MGGIVPTGRRPWASLNLDLLSKLVSRYSICYDDLALFQNRPCSLAFTVHPDQCQESAGPDNKVLWAPVLLLGSNKRFIGN